MTGFHKIQEITKIENRINDFSNSNQVNASWIYVLKQSPMNRSRFSRWFKLYFQVESKKSQIVWRKVRWTKRQQIVIKGLKTVTNPKMEQLMPCRASSNNSLILLSTHSIIRVAADNNVSKSQCHKFCALWLRLPKFTFSYRKGKRFLKNSKSYSTMNMQEHTVDTLESQINVQDKFICHPNSSYTAQNKIFSLRLTKMAWTLIRDTRVEWKINRFEKAQKISLKNTLNRFHSCKMSKCAYSYLLRISRDKNMDPWTQKIKISSRKAKN